MEEYVQEVDETNKEEIISRFCALGWGVNYQWFRNGYQFGVRFVWPHDGPAKYPDLTDLLPPQTIQ